MNIVKESCSQSSVDLSRGKPQREVIKAMAVFYLFALLMNADALYRNAERMPYGNAHNVAVSMTRPVANFAGSVGLTWLRTQIEILVHNEKR